LGQRRWVEAAPGADAHALSIPSVRKGQADSLGAWMDETEDLLTSSDPFRLSHSQPSVAYDPATDGAPGAGALGGIAPMYRPAMTLKGIVGGPPWQAMIDGLPGQPPGTVVRTGGTYDRLTIRSVTRDSVIVKGPDTTWVLSFRRRP